MREKSKAESRAESKAESKAESRAESKAEEIQNNWLPLSGVEVDILRFLNEFGFCEIKQISKKFDLQKTCAYSYMQMLIKRGLVINARIIKNQPRAFSLTLKGIDLLKLDLPLVRKIPLSIYDHQLAVLDVSIKLQLIYPDATWITERRLYRERNKPGVSRDYHLPDGVLIFQDGKQCAIEVEKSQKTKDRLEGIILGYGLQCEFKEVWYFCSPQVLSAVSKISENMPYIKIFRLSEYV